MLQTVRSSAREHKISHMVKTVDEENLDYDAKLKLKREQRELKDKRRWIEKEVQKDIYRPISENKKLEL